MSAFKKKSPAADTNPSISDINNKLNLLLGLGSSTCPQQHKKGSLNKQLILACAMFWDSKKRIDKIRSLILKQQQLNEFNSSQDFQVSELMSIQLLSLSKNNIMHLQPLSVLDTLVCLNVNNNRVYDLSPLAELPRLEELYAANNQIAHIDALKALGKLRIVNLFSNKINRLDETVGILSCLAALEELDIEQNPVYSPESRSKFVALPKLARLNNELILQDERSELGLLTTSSVFMPSAKFRDTHTSFFGNKSQLVHSATTATQSGSTSQKRVRSKAEIAATVEDLERKYYELDEKFEEEIVRNVQLKSQYHRQLENKRQLERKMDYIKQKQQEITPLKRKVKTLKQNLFSNAQNPKKSELLRQLFELQMLKQLGKQKTQTQKALPVANEAQVSWVRKFDYDEQILISNKSDDQYLLDQDQEIAMLLTQNSSALEQLKRELREISQ